jgi:transposase-like protein
MKMSLSQLATDVSKAKAAASGRRMRYSEQIKKATVRLFKRQEMTPKDFAEKVGISESALMKWTIASKSSGKTLNRSFIPVTEDIEQERMPRTPRLQVEAASGSGFVVIYVPGSRADLVAAVVRELGVII